MKELATIRATTQRLNQMIEQGSGDYHEDLLIRVTGDRVETLMQTNARQVVSYCTWESSYFDEVSGECEAIMPVGGSGMDQKGFLDYMKFAGGPDGTTEITFLGDGEDGEHAPLASHWQAEGSLNTKLRLPSSDDDLEAVPWDHPVRWTPDNQYASVRCLEDGELPDDPDDWITGPVVIETTADIIRNQIIDPADFADGVNYYPISTEDGAFLLDVEGSQQDDAIWGEINAESVEGPDVTRQFQPGFPEIFGVLSGPVRIQTAPSGDGDVDPPMTVVQDHLGDRTIRHLISALAGAN